MKKVENLLKTILNNLQEGVYFVDRDRKITYWNQGAERITGYKASEVVGKHCSDNILVHVDEEGVNLCTTELCPATKSMKKGRPCEAEVYLQHKKGHRLPVLIRAIPIRDSKGKTVGAVEIFGENTSQGATQQIEKLQKMALLDPLTGVGNRRHAEINLRRKLEELKRYGWPFGILFVDIDHFKEINDTYGHEAGDKILKMIANNLVSNVRPFDIVSRWGGEEFVVLIVNVSQELLFSLGEKLRCLIEKSSLNFKSDSIKVTVSIGATLAQLDDSVSTLIRRADSLMYKCKGSGRNSILVG
jgi:diguanylate cyclase (GGDEF)-like protein/PAS domain S-box-containing protein